LIDYERAVEFVDTHGDEVERARLRYLLYEEAPSPSIEDVLFAGQRPDGGWAPFWSPDYSSIDATCYRIAQAEQLGLIKAPPVARAIEFLQRRQRGDGSWEEDLAVRDAAPPWAVPGDPAARVYLTANAGYWMARLAGASRCTDRAVAVLHEHLDQYGKLPTFPHAHWLAAGCLYAANQHAIAESIMGYLERAMIDSLPASNLGWLSITLLGAGVPPAQPLIARASTRLREMQQPDGRWLSEDGSSRDVHATLEALRALRLSGA
jgi:hypothetical protein